MLTWWQPGLLPRATLVLRGLWGRESCCPAVAKAPPGVGVLLCSVVAAHPLYWLHVPVALLSLSGLSYPLFLFSLSSPLLHPLVAP